MRISEQILGLSPTNVIDATALPMFDCFTDRADPTPYTALPNQIPLDEMNRPLSGLRGRALYYARQSAEQTKKGIYIGEDALMNRILWFAVKGNMPYPGGYLPPVMLVSSSPSHISPASVSSAGATRASRWGSAGSFLPASRGSVPESHRAADCRRAARQ